MLRIGMLILSSIWLVASGLCLFVTITSTDNKRAQIPLKKISEIILFGICVNRCLIETRLSINVALASSGVMLFG